MTIEAFKQTVNQYATTKTPFLFVVDFEMQQPFVCKIDEAIGSRILYDINGKTNSPKQPHTIKNFLLESFPIRKDVFNEKIEKVIHEQNIGNSYLLNLTFATPISINCSLNEVFAKSKASYKLLFDDKFVVFSPECFVRIVDNSIYTYPMKGTIDASLCNAEQIIMHNDKERCEHNTIVDLMRNDLSMVASNVEVVRYRYLERIKTHKGDILQTSSEIKGELGADWHEHLGDILIRLLPAGSISGAPKEKTVEIIKRIEGEDRGFYTGIFGLFDGTTVDSAVMIRFIEHIDGKCYFRSGGGITARSSAEEEYNELIQKIYVPIV